jgi:hypothetical protein
MNQIDLRQVALADLLAELFLDGRAGHLIPNLSPFEPISLAAILDELRRRTGQDHGADVDAWCDWYLNEQPDAADLDRVTVEYARTRRQILAIERRARRVTSSPTDPGT